MQFDCRINLKTLILISHKLYNKCYITLIITLKYWEMMCSDYVAEHAARKRRILCVWAFSERHAIRRKVGSPADRQRFEAQEVGLRAFSKCCAAIFCRTCCEEKAHTLCMGVFRTACHVAKGWILCFHTQFRSSGRPPNKKKDATADVLSTSF